MSLPIHERTEKGSSLIAFPSDYVVLDVETTGYVPRYDSIIEVGLLRVRNGLVTESFSSLVRPENPVDAYIEELTGITNAMLATAPAPEDVLPTVRSFLGDDLIVGHNVAFDINFLYDLFMVMLREPLTNDFIDTLRLSRRALPALEHHHLKDIASALGVTQEGAHRSLVDCYTTYGCFVALEKMIREGAGIDAFVASFKPKSRSHVRLDLQSVTATVDEFDETHPLYGKRCVFTGALDLMTRAAAAQLVANVGGICDNGVTKKTNYLILGNNDYCSTIKNGKSAKQQKAEALKLAGIDIEILPESVFYDLILDR